MSLGGPGSLAERSAAEGKRMRRTWAALIVAGIFLASAGGAAIIFWQATAHGVPLFYILGTLIVVIGIGFSVLHLSVSDEYLRQLFGGQRMQRGCGRCGEEVGLACCSGSR
jgi:hypothetical protein